MGEQSVVILHTDLGELIRKNEVEFRKREDKRKSESSVIRGNHH